MRVLPYPPTHSHLTALAFPYTGASSSQDQGFLLPLMSDKVILCYICSWSHANHSYSGDELYGKLPCMIHRKITFVIRHGHLGSQFVNTE
ncbi:NADH dehydrogenase (ubiquinone) 1 beta subcomplex, 2 (predicted), isoform CRA_a [Rattus norvegicus]|uniref:NADH dehydrogenase (Ubiquinone) 1 beta subcomplex, 2 (Predicted), isoform CRA_a n=1 Tax=Rattus norvegicus TaxID=10116 RepID=A6IEV8_RAT|nr:NADH dehydrogenase (ubiquinone) 1 beta subcomplex, 2 (predicted), isoform CRA_a [Rattus norvegicus]EDM15396.1 NADH dehydrogenase (ubiquinone) 1 beta subcomplex, 2 (predicted), isoform CRA_a [Rattus norvegicus]